MPDISARLNLPYLLPAQAQKHVTHNAALSLLDALVQCGLAGLGTETPPASPAQGEIHALGASPGGDWAGQNGQLAVFDNGGWLFIAPQVGWRAWDLTGARLVVFDGSAWGPAVSRLEGLGLNTDWDGANRLALAAQASLFSHDGAGHQLKINKANDGDTASVLFQSGFAGHAEIGLAGDTELSFKVSADGSAWSEALRLAPDGTASGAVVQASASDTTAGRLMRADYGYGPGNLLGGVSFSGSTPAGAVIERGSGAGGHYVRLADGTQICWASGNLGHDSAARLSTSWSFPAAFDTAHPIAVHAQLASTSGATPGADALGALIVDQGGTPDGLAVTLWQYRVSGTTDFQSGDSLAFTALATGRWA